MQSLPISILFGTVPRSFRIKNFYIRNWVDNFYSMKKIVITLFCSICSLLLFAQNQKYPGKELTPEKKEYVYKQKVYPTGIDNYLFSTYYYNGKKAYNLRNLTLSSSAGEIVSLRINPSGTSYAILSQKGGKSTVAVYDLWRAKKMLHEFEDIDNVGAICYSPDARKLVLATDSELLYFDARRYTLADTMSMPFAARQLAISGNNYFVAAAAGKRLFVWNMEDKSIRKELELDVDINGLAFSDDCNTFAVLTADGLLTTYDTQDFFIMQSLDAMGEARHMAFHPEGKYMAVVTGDKRISVVNMLDPTDRTYIDNAEGGTSDARFVRDGKKQIFLTYNTLGSIMYRLMSELAPYYTKLLADELNDRMNTWLKRMPGETLEEYNERVNDETRIEQMKLFEQEIATRMAENLLERSEVTLGNYNPETNMLAVNFNTMPSIYLNVPTEEVNDFMDAGNLEFRNVKYGLTKNDKFELVYTDVYNKISGKTYVFDNRDRRSLEHLKEDGNYVPLQLIQQSNMEEMVLQDIKEKVVDAAKRQNAISDHTNITVDAKIISDVDASGKKIMNYRINFSYEVEKGFSAQEDFAPGKYKTEESGAATSMLSVVKNAFEGEFARYVKSGKKLAIKITGMADALPINGKIAYDGCYGDFENEPIYKDEDLSNITVTCESGITQNEQLAFLRAMGVKEKIAGNVAGIASMNTDYRYYIKLTEGRGGEFRRINVEFTFINAF